MGRQPPQSIIEAAQACQRNWCIPACISIAQWAQESAWGARFSAKNNCFGIKAVKGQSATVSRTREVIDGKSIYVEQRFRNFNSVAEAFHEHGRLLATGSAYIEAREHLNDPKAFANALTKHYATDPFYGRNLIAVMNGSNLYRFDLPGPRMALADLPASPEPQGKTMNKFVSAGGLAGLFSFGAALAAAFGKNNLSGVLGSPDTIASVGAMIGGIGALISGLLPNTKKAAA